jgi:acetoin utilization deacetylase AcuC-like enzyme
MRVCFADGYFSPLPEGHRFPMGKFPALHNILLSEGLITELDVVTPEEASWEDLHLVHDTEYLRDLREGSLDRKAERRMGLPWSAPLVRRSRLATQGTIQAMRMALEDGISANLAGGMHHGYPGFGEGFCVLNDVAVAIRCLQRDKMVNRVLLIDLDVHQGNGNAAVFENDESVFTFSMHGEKNFPFRKEQSDLDVPLPDGTGDDAYLSELEGHLDSVYASSKPDIVIYLAGVDVVSGDRFGRLEMTPDGLAVRDWTVLHSANHRAIPICVVLSGGYAKSDEQTADLHAVVHREAAQLYTS